MHKLHSSTQGKHKCLNSDPVYLDKLKLQVQTNSTWPGVGLGLILLGHKLFVCFPIDIIWWHCTAQPRKENKYLHVNKKRVVEEEKVDSPRHQLKQ